MTKYRVGLCFLLAHSINGIVDMLDHVELVDHRPAVCEGPRCRSGSPVGRRND